MRLSVVIPNYNGARMIASVVDAVLQQPLPECSEVVVFDDCSTDGSTDLLSESFGKAIRIEVASANRGASSTRNAGIAVTSGEWVLLIDSDVLLTHGALATLLREAEGYDLAFPKIVYTNGEVMYPVNDTQASYPLISPAFLVRRVALEKLGTMPFDETYGIYGEDTDFFLRAYLAGLRANYVANAVVVHDAAPRTGNREGRYYLEVRNSLYGAVKFAGVPGVDVFDHAFKPPVIAKVLACGILNFDLFDLQARGLRKYGGIRYNLGLVLRNRDHLTDRCPLILLALISKAILWNIHHLRTSLTARASVRSLCSRGISLGCNTG